VLFSTHILSDVERICTDVALLHHGKIEMQGTVEELKRTRYTEEFLVETETGEAAQALLQAFAEARLHGQDTVIFNGGAAQMRAVLGYLHENAVAIRKIERLEPSIESLFLEVVGK
jgi:ABC-2 type transport system ATP-binding protein